MRMLVYVRRNALKGFNDSLALGHLRGCKLPSPPPRLRRAYAPKGLGGCLGLIAYVGLCPSGRAQSILQRCHFDRSELASEAEKSFFGKNRFLDCAVYDRSARNDSGRTKLFMCSISPQSNHTSFAQPSAAWLAYLQSYKVIYGKEGYQKGRGETVPRKQ